MVPLLSILSLSHDTTHTSTHLHVRTLGSNPGLSCSFFSLAATEKFAAKKTKKLRGRPGFEAIRTLPAGPPKGESRVYLILDLDKSVQHHGPTVVQVHLVLLHPRLVSFLLRVLGREDSMV